MKIHIEKQSRQQGSALLVTLTFGVILLIALASYISLLSAQKNIVTRSQSWNAALSMAEAGIEESMAQVNAQAVFNGFNAFTNFNSSSSTNMSFSNNGWSLSSGVFVCPQRTLLGGSYNTIVQTNNTPTPIIYSTGYTTVPIVGSTISRTVKITTSRESLFNVGIGAVSNIDFNGNTVVANSWNSHNTNLSTAGAYDSSKTSTNGNVASVDGIVNPGNDTIQGNLYLGANATDPGITPANVTGQVYNDYNVQFPDVTLPTDSSGNPLSWATMTTTNISGTQTYDFKTSGNYLMNANHPIIVEAGVTVAIQVTSTTFSPTSLLIHGGTVNSGTAVFYFNGPTSVSMAGNTAVDASNRPENLWYFGMPSLTSITFSGTSSFVGVIYAPEVDLTLNGGGAGFGIMGSIITKSITMHGHYDVHYDEYLQNIGPSRGYVASSWLELF